MTCLVLLLTAWTCCTVKQNVSHDQKRGVETGATFWREHKSWTHFWSRELVAWHRENARERVINLLTHSAVGFHRRRGSLWRDESISCSCQGSRTQLHIDFTRSVIFPPLAVLSAVLSCAASGFWANKLIFTPPALNIRSPTGEMRRDVSHSHKHVECFYTYHTCIMIWLWIITASNLIKMNWDLIGKRYKKTRAVYASDRLRGIFAFTHRHSASRMIHSG